jgi:hypothetical protein
MATGNAQILRLLDYNWVECQDAQGIFYFNEATQQSSETVPPELLGGQASAPGPVTYASPTSTAAYAAPNVQQQYGKAQVIGGGITQTGQSMLPQTYISQTQAQQIYAPSQTRPAYPQQVQATQYQQPSYLSQPQYAASSYTPIQQTVQVQPAQYQVQQPTQYQVQQPQYQVQQPTQYQVQQPQYQVQQSQYQVQQSMPQGSPAVQKMAFGDWAVYQDELGEFYTHVPTGQQFEQPPPELIQAYQQYRG